MWTRQLNNSYWTSLSLGELPISMSTSVSSSSTPSSVQELLGDWSSQWTDEQAGFNGVDYDPLGLSFVYTQQRLFCVRYSQAGSDSNAVLLPMGFTWSMTLTDVRGFLSSYSAFDNAFPLCVVQDRGKRISLMWPGLHFEFDKEQSLKVIDFMFPVLDENACGIYRDICFNRHVEGQRWVGLQLPELVPLVEIGEGDEMEEDEEDATTTNNKPIYQHAIDVLRACGGGPMHYNAISARLKARGLKISGESVLGSLSAYVSSKRGKQLVDRIGNGEYQLRHKAERLPYLYQEAYNVLLDAGRPMHYKEITSVINTSCEQQTTADKVLGSLSGWFASAGERYLTRPEPGTYCIRQGTLYRPFLPGKGDDGPSKKRARSVSSEKESSDSMASEEEGEGFDPKKIKVDSPTFLHVYKILRENPDRDNGITSAELARMCTENGHKVTSQRLISRMSAYTSYRRKKKLPDLFEKDGHAFYLSDFGRRVMSDPARETALFAGLLE